MKIDDIRVLKHAKPFQPFDIVTTKGKHVRIDLPHSIALSPKGESVTGFAPDGSFYLMLSEIAQLKPCARRKSKKL